MNLVNLLSSDGQSNVDNDGRHAKNVKLHRQSSIVHRNLVST